jgi:chemotaxis protein histidine kinase CheA
LDTVNGSVSIDSAAGQGTLVVVRIPLELDAAHA